MDNASIHHAAIPHIQRACARQGVIMRFLPPYSPDFNPIEESFNDLKSWIRRHYRRQRPNFQTYEDFLQYAIAEVGIGADAARQARGHFRHAGIHGVPVE